MMRMLLIITAVSLTVASDVAYAGAGGAGASGFSWNQVAADTSARAWVECRGLISFHGASQPGKDRTGFHSELQPMAPKFIGITTSARYGEYQ